MNRTLLCAIAALSLLAAMPVKASEPEKNTKLVETLFAEVRVSGNATFTDDDSQAKFTGDYLNVNIAGHITDNVSYRIRQRFTKNVYDENHILNGTDFAWLTWQIDDKWSLTAGKYPDAIGGYEFDEAPIDLYYCSSFCNNLYQYYVLGAIGGYAVKPGQNLLLQISESPLANAAPNTFSYSLMWRGSFSSWWNTLWSLNFIEDRSSRFMNYISLGNQIVLDNFTWELDFQNRAGFGQSNPFLTDWSVVSNFEYRVGKFNFLLKGGYDINKKDNFDDKGVAYDLAVLPGDEYFYAGGGFEFFPLEGRDDIRIHAIYDWNNAAKASHFSVGVKWRVNFVK